MNKIIEELSDIYASLSDGIVITDHVGYVIIWNSSMEILTGITANTALGKPVDEVFKILHIVSIQNESNESSHETVFDLQETTIPGQSVISSVRVKTASGLTKSVRISFISKKLTNGNYHFYIFSEIPFTGMQQPENDYYDKFIEGIHSLRISEEKLARAFRLAPISISVTTLEQGKFLEVNDEFLRNTGYSRSDIIGKTVQDINLWVPVELREKIVPVLRKGIPVKNFETNFRIKNGEIHNYIYSAEPVKLGDEDSLISIFFDITEKRLLEDALRVSEEKFSRSFRLAPISISVTTLEDGRFVEVNDEFLKNTGYTRREVVGKTVFDIKLWEPASKRENVLLLLNAGMSVKNEEICFRHKNSDLHSYIYSAEPIFIDGENCIISIFFDVTEKKKLEDALKMSEDMYKTIFECTGSAMTIVNKDVLMLVNNEMVSFTGFSREELEGKMSWLDFVLPEYVKEIQKSSVNLMEGSSSQIVKNEFKARDRIGNLKDVYCLMARGPEDFEYVVTLIDMTEYNHLLNRINEISKREQQRIGEMLHDNLIQYLTGISLIIRSLEIRLIDKKNVDLNDISKIRDLIGESLSITKKLLKGMFLVEINYEGLPDALKNLAISINELYNISCIFNDECSPVDIDIMKATELYYIANEAVHNAVKHSGGDEICIILRQEGGKTVLEVRDNGKGFELDNIAYSEGLGLKLMSFRAKLIDAKIKIRNNIDGMGAKIECKL